MATAVHAASAQAQGNYHYSPLGGRAALMGGTGVAIGTDGAAPFLNPATILRIESGSLAFSAKFFRIAQRRLDDWHQPGPVDPAAFGNLRLTGVSAGDLDFESVSDTTCFFFGGQRLSSGLPYAQRHAFALCIAKTEESDFGLRSLAFSGQSAGLVVNQLQNLEQSWSSRSFGPAWAYALSEQLWLGAAVYGVRDKLTDSFGAATIVTDPATGSASASNFVAGTRGESWGALAHFGLSYRFAPYTVGLSVRTPALHIADRFRASQSATSDVAGSSTRQLAGEGDFIVRSPLRIAAGIAGEWRLIRVELDGFFHAGQSRYAEAELTREVVTVDGGSLTSRVEDQVVVSERVEPVANLGIGAELFVTEKLGILAGFSTDFSALPELTSRAPERSLFRARTSWLHAGLGVAAYSDYGDLGVGVRGDYGYGQMAALNAFVVPQRFDPVGHRELALMLVFAGRLNLATIKAAVGGEAKPETTQGGARQRRE